MIRRSTLILFEILVGTLVTLGFGVAFMAWRLSQGPITLVPVKRQIESQLSEARGGRPVRIDRVELAWSPEDRGLELKARGVKALSADGRLLTESRAVDIGVSLPHLAFGRLAVDQADFDGADITMTLAADGSAGIAFGPPGSPADFVIPPPPPNETPSQRVNRLLDGLRSAFRPVGIGGALRSVRVEHVRLTVVDEKTGSVWKADEARIALSRQGQAIALNCAADLKGPRGAAPATLSIRTGTDFDSAQVSLTASGVQPAALAPVSAMGPLASLRAPVTAAISIGLDRRVGVTRFEGDVRLGRGYWQLADGRMEIAGGRLRGDYDIAHDVLSVKEIMLGGEGGTRIQGRLAIDHASAFLGGGGTAPAVFNVSMPELAVEAPGVFSRPVAVRNLVMKGEIAPADARVSFEEASFSVDNARVQIGGKIYWGNDGAGRIRPGFEVRGDIKGALDARSMLALWPLKLGEGARSWLETGLLGGRVLTASVRADITPAMLAMESLPNDRLHMDLTYDGARVQYFEGMTPITEGRGSAVMQGNRFDLVLVSGKVGTLAVSNGKVELPRLKPKGAVATYSGRAEGDARAMVELIHQMPIDIESRFPAQVPTIVGRGVADFELKRPMLKEVRDGDLKWTIDARLDGVGGVAKDNRYTVSNWRMRAVGGQDALTFSGPMTLNASAVNLTWTEAFGRNLAAPSRYVIDGRFDARDLERLGIGVAAYANGPVGVQLRGDGRGLDMSSGAVRVDLKDAEVVLPKRAWVKRPGRPATATFDVRGAPDGALTLADLDMKGPGFAANGTVNLGADNSFQGATLQRVWIDGRTDLRVTARRTREGVIQVAANGPMFDAAPFMAADAPAPPEKVASAPPPRTGALPVVARDVQVVSAPVNERWDYAIQADRILMKGDAELSMGRLEMTLVGPLMTRLDLRGGGPNNSTLQLSLGAPNGAMSGPISFKADDMGFAYRAVTGADNVRGGAVEGAGTWQAQTQRAEVVVKARNFQVVKLGPMARLLTSVGSLRGLAETLNGDGVSFTGLEAPLTIADGTLYVAESRAAGPSIGITAKGTVTLADGNLDLDGVLVPSYGLNSMLSGVPVLGQLLASRPGEGVLGLTYSMNGPSDQPRVGVNPLSALTPGILRRIFEPWSAPAQPPKAATPGSAPSNG